MSDSGLMAVFMANRPLVERLLVARTRSRDEAEEVLQELWLRLEQSRPGPIRQPLSYIMRVALNLASDRAMSAQSRRGREEAWTSLQPESAEFPDPEESLLAKSELARVKRAIEQMPANMSQALIMFRLEGQSQGAIARQLAMSVSGVEKLLAKAYRKLADLRQDNTLAAVAGSGMPQMTGSKFDVG